MFFKRFCPVEKCGVTLHGLYRDSLTLKTLKTKKRFSTHNNQLNHLILLYVHQKIVKIDIRKIANDFTTKFLNIRIDTKLKMVATSSKREEKFHQVGPLHHDVMYIC